MELIQKYLDNIYVISDMTLDDYGNSRKVRKTNKMADEIRQIATDIENKYPELKQEFAKLLENDHPRVRGWTAHHMLEVMDYPRELRKKALDEIRNIAENDSSINGLGNQMWLKSWFKKHPEDMEL